MVNVRLTKETSFESSESLFVFLMARFCFELPSTFWKKMSGNTSKNPTKNNREKVHTRPTVLGKTYFETYEDVSSINFHCQKKIVILEADGFPFRSPTCQRVTDEKIPRVTEPLNPSTPTKPRKHTNHKHNLSSQPVFLCFPWCLFHPPLCFFGDFPSEFLLQSKATYHGVCQPLPKSNLLFQVLPRASVLRHS